MQIHRRGRPTEILNEWWGLHHITSIWRGCWDLKDHQVFFQKLGGMFLKSFISPKQVFKMDCFSATKILIQLKVVYLIIILPAGTSIRREEIFSSFSEWYKDCSPPTSQDSECNCDSSNSSGISSGNGLGNQQSHTCGYFPAAPRGFCLPKQLQNRLRIHHFRLCHASIRRWWSLCYRWCSGQLFSKLSYLDLAK